MLTKRFSIDHTCDGSFYLGEKMRHGFSRHQIYPIWHEMNARCYNIKHPYYKDYGAFGITVCNEWKETPKNFIEWATKNGYKKGLQIDRRENNKNYNPSNCRFVTPRQNSLNRRLLRRNNTSGYEGVSIYKNKKGCQAYIKINGKTIHCGRHRTRELAVMARNQYIIENNLQNEYKIQEIK